ncbi:MAG: beta-propeller domain-containing protein [Eubacterium sp.]|nr:beta-propeller domain-containing protein [Eubacterium sp.]
MVYNNNDGREKNNLNLIKQFLSELRGLKLSGREFLALIGNTKISNSAYNEIKNNPNLTYERLIEIFSDSPLTMHDYINILKSARAYNESKKRKYQEEMLKRAVAVAEKKIAAAIERSEEYTGAPEAETPGSSVKAAEEPLKPTETKKEIQDKYYPNFKHYGKYPEDLDDNEDSDEYYGESYGFSPKKQTRAHQRYIPSKEFEEEENNNVKLITSWILSMAVIFISFLVRYQLTGSPWIVDSDKIIYDPPASYQDLALRLSGMNGADSEPALVFDENYYLQSDAAPKKYDHETCENGKYVFRLYNNKLCALEINRGQIKPQKSVSRAGKTFKSVFLHGNKLYAILTGEYVREYEDISPLSINKEETAPRKGSFTQPSTTVLMFDALNYTGQPITEITADGSVNNILTYEGEVILATDYKVKDPFAHNDMAAFVPHIQKNDEEKRPVKLENIFIPLNKAYYSNITVITRIMPNGETLTKAAVGGKNSWLYINQGSLYVIQLEDEKSRIVRYTVSGENIIESGYFETDGMIYKGGIDTEGGLIRVVSTGQKGISLYLYRTNPDLEFSEVSEMNKNFKRLSTVSKIGEGNLSNVLFDMSYTYIIEKNSSGGQAFYVVDTTNPDSPIFAEEGFSKIYNDNGMYYWSDTERLSFENNRLIMYKISSDSDALEEAFSTSAAPQEDFISLSSGGEIYCSPEKSLIIVPLCYFNGISKIEKFIIYTFNESTSFAKQGEIVYYDINKNRHAAVAAGDHVYTFWDDMAVSAEIMTGRVIDEEVYVN